MKGWIFPNEHLEENCMKDAAAELGLLCGCRVCLPSAPPRGRAREHALWVRGELPRPASFSCMPFERLSFCRQPGRSLSELIARLGESRAAQAAR